MALLPFLFLFSSVSVTGNLREPKIIIKGYKNRLGGILQAPKPSIPSFSFFFPFPFPPFVSLSFFFQRISQGDVYSVVVIRGLSEGL